MQARLPKWCSGRGSSCQWQRHKRRGFDPWVGKIWSRKWQSAPVFVPRKSHGQRSLRGYRQWGHKEVDTTEHPALYRLTVHLFTDTCRTQTSLFALLRSDSMLHVQLSEVKVYSPWNFQAGWIFLAVIPAIVTTLKVTGQQNMLTLCLTNGPGWKQPGDRL